MVYKKFLYHRMIFLIYIIALFSFFFLRSQEISSQQLAAAVTLLIIPCIGILKKSKATYKTEVLVFLFYISIEILVSLNRYQQDFLKTAYYIANIYSILLYIYFAAFNDDIWYYKAFNKIGRLIFGSLIFSIFFYYMGIKFLDSTVYLSRDGMLRMTVGMMFCSFVIIVVFGRFVNIKNINRKMSLNDCVFFCIAIIYIVLVTQTRMTMLGIGLAIVVMIVFCVKNLSRKVLIVVAGIITLLVILQIPSIQDYLGKNVLGVIAGTDNSIIPRTGAISHYIQMAENNKFVGLGIINPNATSNGLYDLNYIMRGPWGVYFYDDVGVFSFYMMFGLFGLMMYAFIFIRLFKRAWKERYIMPYKLGLVVYVFVTGFSMIITDLWRQSNIALFLLLMDLNLQPEEQKRY
ncbi:O-antigen ligase family protein [Paenibacillus mesotrionivorans]|uniref:O-antigen ligase family protein n=1 Tax=Paenibacillus mesotrionivorans TaxID=3160968 RepID=A0ACC7NVG7_9BACL